MARGFKASIHLVSPSPSTLGTRIFVPFTDGETKALTPKSMLFQTTQTLNLYFHVFTPKGPSLTKHK